MGNGIKIDDSAEMDKVALSIIAPNAFAGERKELNFLELIFLSAITLSNKRAEKPKHKGEKGFEEYALRQLKNIKVPLFSKKLYESLVMTFMDSLRQEIVKKYDEIRIPFIRGFLLSPKYQNRKDVEAALETYLKKLRSTSYFKEDDDFDMPEISITLSKDNAFRFVNQFKTLTIIEQLEIIIPLTELILLGCTMKQNANGFYIFDSYREATIFKGQEQDVNNIIISPYVYGTANRIAEIIKTYIDNAIELAAEMLFSLEEANIVNTSSMKEFLQAI